MITIIDVSNILYAGHFTKPNLVLRGPSINTTNGYTSYNIPAGGLCFLFRYLYTYRDTTIVLAFDGHHILKKENNPKYKSNRNRPDAIILQDTIARLILKDIGYDVMEDDLYEADDFIHNTALKYCKNHSIKVVTNDSDMYHLVRPSISIEPASSKGKHLDMDNFERNAVKNRLMPYNMMVPYKVLYGDSTDMIATVFPKSLADDIFDYMQNNAILPICSNYDYLKRFMSTEALSSVAERFIHNLDIVYPYKVNYDIEFKSINTDKLRKWGRAIQCSYFGKSESHPYTIDKIEEWLYNAL